MNVRAAAVAALVVATFASLSRAQESRGGDAAPADPEVFEQAWRLVRDHFYDKRYHGLDWDAARLRWQPRVRAAATRREVHELILAMLAELKTSHVTLIEPDVQKDHVESEMKNRLAASFGLDLVRLDQGFFVSEVAAGSPAAAAGIVRGDRLLKVDGSSVEEAGLRPGPWDPGVAGSPRVYYLSAQTGSAALELERRRTAQTPGYNVFATKLAARPWNEIEATRASVRVLEGAAGTKLGYVRLYHLLGEDVTDVVADALARGPLASADGVVLDVRGRGGLSNVVDRLVGLFDRRHSAVWTKPAVALVDRETRSANEILAWRWREAGVGPLVGERTRGAVIGSRFFTLSDGATLQVAVSDTRALTGGHSLEGHGLEPDVSVADELAYAQGRDPILDRGVAVLLDAVLARRRAERPHGWY